MSVPSPSLTAVAYEPSRKAEWDDFVRAAKNGVFLFLRDYMEYHADRFPDASLMFYDARGELIALLPATACDGILSSHAGLTFGGLVSGPGMKVELMFDVFAAMVAAAEARGIRQIVYKPVPHIYHRSPAEEDLYALFRNDAVLVRRDVSLVVDNRARLPLSKGRRWGLGQARRQPLEVRPSVEFEMFMAIETELLRAKYGAQPTHSGNELRLLAERFPDHIKLFAAYLDSRMVAGIVIYESERVAHTQYIGANDEGRRASALDMIVDFLMNDRYTGIKYFDFGTSTDPDGRNLNAGLIENKQSYGARAIMYDCYRLDLPAV